MPVIPKAFTYFEKRNESANESKFWAMRFFKPTTTKGSRMALHVWWGRIGTKGGDKVFNDYTTDNECLQDAKARAESKLREGYKPVTVAGWFPEFLKLVDREPTTPATAPMIAWSEVGEGRSPEEIQAIRERRRTRGPERRDYFTSKTLGEIERRRAESQPSVIRKREERKVVAVISTVRVIDFEE